MTEMWCCYQATLDFLAHHLSPRPCLLWYLSIITVNSPRVTHFLMVATSQLALHLQLKVFTWLFSSSSNWRYYFTISIEVWSDQNSEFLVNINTTRTNGYKWRSDQMYIVVDKIKVRYRVNNSILYLNFIPTSPILVVALAGHCCPDGIYLITLKVSMWVHYTLQYEST